MIKSVKIIGMGALGILFGHQLTKHLGNGQVKFIVNNQRFTRYQQERILWNNEECNFSFITEEELKVEKQLEIEKQLKLKKHNEYDLLIFAVKATALSEAIQSARDAVGENTIIISLLNGISSEDILGHEFGMEHMIHSVAQGMDAVRSGNQLTFTKMGQICMGVTDRSSRKLEMLQQVAELFDKVQIPYTIEENIMHRLWSKFMLNVGVNQVVTIQEGTYDTIQKDGEPRELMKNAMREVINLAACEGILLTENDLEGYIALIDTLSPDGMPSMRQDGLNKRYSEVELFAGTVINCAKKHNLEVPINQYIYEKINDLEKEYSN